MKKVLYGIDMGAPSKKGGFYCWKQVGNGFEDETLSLGRSSHERWISTQKDIIKELRNGNSIHIAIEAPLLGKDSTKGEWQPRFQVTLDEGIAHEHPYYVSAGGATAFMAQAFLAELINLIEKPHNKITLYECYTSGLSLKEFTIVKPEPTTDMSQSHRADAYDCLTMLRDRLEKTEKTINVVDQIALVPVGILSTAIGKEHFKVYGKILVTHRKFEAKESA